jgi:hypothetical protein
MTDQPTVRRQRFDEKVRDYLERIGHHYFLNESSGLYEPHPRRSLLRDLRTDHHGAPLQVNVQRDRWAIGIPAALSVLTLLLLIATVLYTRRQWLETNRSANGSETAGNAAESAAKTAGDTLHEMRYGKGAQDTDTLAHAAQTQAGASLISSRAAESAANTARATLELHSSPWLGMEKDEADAVTSSISGNDHSINAAFTIRLHNYGSAPAFDVSIYVPQKAEGQKWSGPDFFHRSNVCAEPNQAKRDVEARNIYGVEHVVWPSDYRDFKRSINTSGGSVSYFPGCISYRGHSGGFKHTLFFYAISVGHNQVKSVTLMGLEPQ